MKGTIHKECVINIDCWRYCESIRYW